MLRQPLLLVLLSLSTLAGCTAPTSPPRDVYEEQNQMRLSQRVRELEAMVAMQQRVLATPATPAPASTSAPESLARVIEQLVARNGALEGELATLRANTVNTSPPPDSRTSTTTTVPQAQGFVTDPVLRALVDQLRSAPAGQAVQLTPAQQSSLLRALGPTFAEEARRARFKTLDGDPVPASSLRQIRNSL